MAPIKDPNKYSKNKDIKPESLLSVLLASISFGLMLTGIVGITMSLFKETSWLRVYMSHIFDSMTNLLSIPAFIFVFWLLDRWMTSPDQSQTRKSANLPMYMMMVIGAYYAYQFITTGSL